jgi:predicted NAD/FAD-dependent oxidoreductase
MSSRRSDHGVFDHGAPIFRCRGEAFQHQVESWIAQGWVSPWKPKWSDESDVEDQPWFVVQPKMSRLCRELSQGLEFKTQKRAQSISRSNQTWHIDCEDGDHFEADQVCITIPAPQCSDLLHEHDPELSTALRQVPFHATWAALFSFKSKLSVNWDIHRNDKQALQTIIREQTKPNREAGERVVVHASARWSDAHSEVGKEAALIALTDALKARVGDLPDIEFSTAHLWRYAHSSAPWNDGPTFKNGLGIAGDWCYGAGVESAWKSGHQLAELIISE